MKNKASELVCVCMDVSREAIVEAIQKHGLKTVERVGDITEAGMNCGACQGDIQEILKQINNEL